MMNLLILIPLTFILIYHFFIKKQKKEYRSNNFSPKVEPKRAKVVSLEKREGELYDIKFDNGDFGITRIKADFYLVEVVERANWIEYEHTVNASTGLCFVDILRGETTISPIINWNFPS